jgi:hypothetical protein
MSAVAGWPERKTHAHLTFHNSLQSAVTLFNPFAVYNIAMLPIVCAVFIFNLPLMAPLRIRHHQICII